MMSGIVALSYFAGERHTAKAANEPFESGIVTVGLARLRVAANFYLIAMFFVIFDVEALFLYAWAIAVREAGWAGYIEAIVFIGILLAALAYLWRLGALGWDRGKHRPKLSPMQSSTHEASEEQPKEPDHAALVAKQGN